MNDLIKAIAAGETAQAQDAFNASMDERSQKFVSDYRDAAIKSVFESAKPKMDDEDDKDMDKDKGKAPVKKDDDKGDEDKKEEE